MRSQGAASGDAWQPGGSNNWPRATSPFRSSCILFRKCALTPNIQAPKKREPTEPYALAAPVRICAGLCQERVPSGTRCCIRDEGGPFGADLQEQASNNRKLLPSNVGGGERYGKGVRKSRHVRVRETNASEPPMRPRNRSTGGIKTGAPPLSGRSMAETWLLAMRCPGYRWRDSNLGSGMELENLFGGAKGKGTSGSPARPKVLIRRAGADCSAVAVKRGNSRGAKGTGHSRNDQLGQLVTGGADWLWRRAAALTEWHEPCDGRLSRTVL